MNYSPEIEAHRQAYFLAGGKQVTRKQYAADLAALGYTLGQNYSAGLCRCDSLPSVPATSALIFETDTGRSAFHEDSRRDANFQALQEYRQKYFAVIRGRLFTI